VSNPRRIHACACYILKAIRDLKPLPRIALPLANKEKRLQETGKTGRGRKEKKERKRKGI